MNDASTPASLTATAGAAFWTRALAARLPALLPVLLFLPAVLAPPINHDVAAVIAFTQRWLAGERLYSDLIDVNPPLIFVLNLLPAGLAAISGISGTVAVRLCVLGFGVWCWALAWRVRRRPAEGPVERTLLDMLPGFFLLGGGYDFGQREHLMVVAALPYVLCASRRAMDEHPRGWIAVTVTAAVGFALKPHFLGIPLLVEFGVLLARVPVRMGGASPARRFTHALGVCLRDPAPWIMLGLWLAYLASIPLLFGDYVHVLLPLVWDFYVGLGELSPWRVLLVPRMGTAVMLLLLGLFFAFAKGTRRAGVSAVTLPRLLGFAALGAVASAMAQHKGWSYHIVPTEMLACALASILAARWLERGQPATGIHPARVAGALLWLCTLYTVANGEAPWNELDYANSDARGLTERMERYAGGKQVLILSPGIAPIYPAVNYAHVTVPLRTMNMWLLQAVNETCPADGKRYREVGEMSPAEIFVFRTVAEDFTAARPEAVVIDKDPGIPWCGEEFDFLAYFHRNPLFAGTWSHYQLAEEWKRYRFYIRKD